MFTIRFETHHDSYRVFSCESYSVGSIADSQYGVGWAISLYSSGEDEPPFMMAEIGEKHPYREAFVTNEQGKTIDRINYYNISGQEVPAVTAM